MQKCLENRPAQYLRSQAKKKKKKPHSLLSLMTNVPALQVSVEHKDHLGLIIHSLSIQR